MAGHTVVATANVLYKLPLRDARAALSGVLELAPDLVGLQEWNPPRYRLLRETGSVSVLPRLGVPRRQPALRGGGYRWATPLVGGCAVGARADRFELVRCRSVVLSAPGRSERPDHWLSLEPPRVATVARYRDLLVDRTVCLINYHLAPGVQGAGRYRDDRPILASRHQGEVRSVERLVVSELAAGHVVYAVGDSNFDGLRLRGLTSAWEGREGEPGTLGPRRKVDDVHGPGPAESLTLLTNDSDHKAVVVRRTGA
jgi:hypothetical protein